jgi:hypothetical protein
MYYIVTGNQSRIQKSELANYSGDNSSLVTIVRLYNTIGNTMQESIAHCSHDVRRRRCTVFHTKSRIRIW